MDAYKYETHLHTKEGSACATLDAVTQVRLYKELGYTGVMITDHFFGGNTCIPRQLPWREKIERYCRGYEQASEEGKRLGIQVFFGIEMGFRGTEFLVYGVDKEWLLRHPDMMEWGIKEQYEQVSKAGGLVVHAHPFRYSDPLKAPLYSEYIDAVEVYNLENDRRNIEYNKKALEFSKKTGLPMTGGGDAHHIDSCRGGIMTNERINSIEDYMTLIKTGKGYQIIGGSEKVCEA